MQDNLAYEYEDEAREELIDGEVAAMSPQPLIGHGFITGNILTQTSHPLLSAKVF